MEGTPMTDHAPRSALIRETFQLLRERLAPASVTFYNALFRRAPHLRRLFRDDLAGQGMKFMTTLGFVIENINRTEMLTDRLSELGHVHAIMGVRATDFEPMGEALMDTLHEELGAAFTPEAEAAWRSAYADLSNRIIALGAIG
jgi:hemoglobin-like flavoprotein